MSWPKAPCPVCGEAVSTYPSWWNKHFGDHLEDGRYSEHEAELDRQQTNI